MMKVRKWALLLVCGWAAACTRTPRSPEQAIQRVDDRVYYPERLGLKRLTAEVDCPYLDEHFQNKVLPDTEAARSLKNFLPLKIRFSWEAKQGGRYEYLSVPEAEKESRAFLDQAFSGTEILVMPPTEAENFRPFNLSFGPWQDKFRIIGVNREPGSDFIQYSVIVDQAFRIVTKQYFSREYVSTTQPTYREENQKLLLTDLVTVQKPETPDPEVVSEAHLTYSQVQGFMLVKSLEYVFKQRSRDQEKVFRGPLLINFRNYSIETEAR